MPIFKALSNAASGLWDFGKRNYNKLDKWTGGRMTKMIKAGAKHAITYGLSQVPVAGPMLGATAAYLMNQKHKDDDPNDYILKKAMKYSQRPKTNDITTWFKYGHHMDKEKKKQLEGKTIRHAQHSIPPPQPKAATKPAQTDPSKMMQH